ncbi:MAG: hypothetical protein ACMXYE_00980 [Candidatus Woesearchaeota archaeon]
MLNVQNKILEIRQSDDLNHYKNLKHDLKKYKRVHVNDSFIILFFDENNIVHFVDYTHHDVAYKRDKKRLERYKNLKFD